MIWTANIPIAGQISSSLQSIFLIPLLSNLSFASFPLFFSRYSFLSFPTILFHYSFLSFSDYSFPLFFSILFRLFFFHYSFSTYPFPTILSHYPFPAILSPLSFPHYPFFLSFSILFPFCIALLPFAGIGCFLKMPIDNGLATWGWPFEQNTEQA